ncbi:SDR family oxidoreductase [Phaeodactylibacter sp.]|jgi:3-oxoacyl-[acyl-carrier protein] reductase|uniref:SDR family oxidoreductase n=1 Tax=Phaeodactylibacter sp. TaxID=1940289 RepID=UPI0025F3266F|nr:SDR family oxidoreductase [Phaeodactylibacter sp.]MCI4649369.1 SDR family oxidoreductase [Phaeodactylibacter sp.]MCI5093614.1 SDR family oxidoreductase [Phaeodactylibacter sp.]
MNLDLKGKNALVCGSSKGIGKAAAFELAELGANVTLVSRSADKMAAITKEMARVKGQQHDFLAADFTDTADLRKKVRGLTATKPIHILVNNTGGPPGGPITEAELEEFTKAFTTHLICNHLLAKAVLPGMRKEGYGRIINVISTSVKAPLPGLGVSNTVRGAVGNWAKTLANEVGADGITVNNILPGATNTGRLQEIIEKKASATGKSIEDVTTAMQSSIPLQRFAEPGEIGAAIAFLATPAAAYITGVALAVDGGRLKNM